MSAPREITVSLPREILAEIEASVEAGGFMDTSEAIREAVRRWRRARKVIAASDAELRRLVAEGRASGGPVDGEEAFTRLRETHVRMAAGANG